MLAFWFGDVPPDKRFAKDAALDATIKRLFAVMRDDLVANPAGWDEDARTTLAAVILLDQFSRNIFRGDPRAFEADALARRLASDAIDKGWDEALDDEGRQFLYMPFMHSETMEGQQRSIALFSKLDNAQSLEFARRHAEQIERFGRFPQRNNALGRISTAEEVAFLSQPGVRF